jgi:hypothetical protein
VKSRRRAKRYKAVMLECYWTIKGEDAVKELLAVERLLNDALTGDD